MRTPVWFEDSSGTHLTTDRTPTLLPNRMTQMDASFLAIFNLGITSPSKHSFGQRVMLRHISCAVCTVNLCITMNVGKISNHFRLSCYNPGSRILIINYALNNGLPESTWWITVTLHSLLRSISSNKINLASPLLSPYPMSPSADEGKPTEQDN
jgi:hypothetical protein